MEQAESIKKAHDDIDKNFSEHLDRCREFLRQKSISATGEGIKGTARIIGDFIIEIGGETQYCGEEDFAIFNCLSFREVWDTEADSTTLMNI
jgi:hypothetical protein